MRGGWLRAGTVDWRTYAPERTNKAPRGQGKIAGPVTGDSQVLPSGNRGGAFPFHQHDRQIVLGPHLAEEAIDLLDQEPARLGRRPVAECRGERLEALQ